MSATPQETQQQLVADINASGDVFSQYTYLLEMASRLPSMDETAKKRATLVEGCQSQVWLRGHERDGRIYFEATSDTLIVKGLIYLMLSIYSGATAAQIIDTPFTLLSDTELEDTLETARRNGVASILRDMKAFAANCQA